MFRHPPEPDQEHGDTHGQIPPCKRHGDGVVGDGIGHEVRNNKIRLDVSAHPSTQSYKHSDDIIIPDAARATQE